MDTPEAPFQKGDRIRLVQMGEDPDPVPAGTTGTVASITWLPWTGKGYWQVSVDWDAKRSLSLVIPPDVAVKI